jgi:hypothetical protein
MRTVSILAPVFLTCAATAGGQEGTASGKLTVAGATTPLRYAYARAEKGFFDEKKEDIRVILSDVPIPLAALSDEFARHQLAAQGKLHAVEVVLDSQKQAISGGLLHEAFREMQGFVSITGMHTFEAKTFDGKMVEGKLSTEKPGKFQEISFEYAAEFRAPVWHRPPPTASGAAAAQTAPGKAVLAFLKAARSGDVAAIKKLMTAEAARELDGPRSKEMVEFLKTATPNPATAQIDSVDITGDTAEVIVVEKSKDGSQTSTMKLALEGGEWKVGGI